MEKYYPFRMLKQNYAMFHDFQNKVVSRIDEMREEAIQLTQELVRIRSLSGEEEKIQTYVHAILSQIGFEVKSYSKVINRPNLIASLFGARQHPNLLLIAHVDNIPVENSDSWLAPPYEAQVMAGRILGRGVADMKAGLAAMIIAAKSIKESGVPINGALSIATVVDEEVDSTYGMRYLADNLLISADAAVFGEPSFPYVAVALKGGAWLKMTTAGKAVGSGWPERGVNAVTNMAKLLLHLEALDFGKASHPLLGRTTIAPGTTINGGTNLHSVPDRCEATVDVYSIPGETTEHILARIQNVIDRLHTEDPNFEASVNLLYSAEPYEIAPNQELLVDLQSCIESVFGSKAELTGVPSIGDARFLGKLGIPAIPAYGPGESGKGHVINESVKIDTLIGVAKVYALLALRMWDS